MSSRRVKVYSKKNKKIILHSRKKYKKKRSRKKYRKKNKKIYKGGAAPKYADTPRGVASRVRNEAAAAAKELKRRGLLEMYNRWKKTLKNVSYDPQEWVCGSCTLKNRPEDIICAVCGSSPPYPSLEKCLGLGQYGSVDALFFIAKQMGFYTKDLTCNDSIMLHSPNGVYPNKVNFDEMLKTSSCPIKEDAHGKPCASVDADGFPCASVDANTIIKNLSKYEPDVKMYIVQLINTNYPFNNNNANVKDWIEQIESGTEEAQAPKKCSAIIEHASGGSHWVIYVRMGLDTYVKVDDINGKGPVIRIDDVMNTPGKLHSVIIRNKIAEDTDAGGFKSYYDDDSKIKNFIWTKNSCWASASFQALLTIKDFHTFMDTLIPETGAAAKGAAAKVAEADAATEAGAAAKVAEADAATEAGAAATQLQLKINETGRKYFYRKLKIPESENIPGPYEISSSIKPSKWRWGVYKKCKIKVDGRKQKQKRYCKRYKMVCTECNIDLTLSKKTCDVCMGTSNIKLKQLEKEERDNSLCEEENPEEILETYGARKNYDSEMEATYTLCASESYETRGGVNDWVHPTADPYRPLVLSDFKMIKGEPTYDDFPKV